MNRIESCIKACRGMKDPVAEINRLQQYDKIPTPCNRGHLNHLPMSLWDCPACTEELRQEKADLLEAVNIGDSLGNSGPVLLNHAADLIEGFAPVTAGELRRKADFEQNAITKATQ